MTPNKQYLTTNHIRSRYVGTNNKRWYPGTYRAGHGTATPRESAYLTDNCVRPRYFGGNHKTWYLVVNRAEPWYPRDACSRRYLSVKRARPRYTAIKHRDTLPSSNRKRPLYCGMEPQ